jgi:hypothetical protein
VGGEDNGSFREERKPNNSENLCTGNSFTVNNDRAGFVCLALRCCFVLCVVLRAGRS